MGGVEGIGGWVDDIGWRQAFSSWFLAVDFDGDDRGRTAEGTDFPPCGNEPPRTRYEAAIPRLRIKSRM
jgi:hypothetical protein